MIARPVSTRPRQTGATAVLVAAVVAAVGMGLLSAVSPTLAIGGLVAVVAVPAAIARPKVLAYALAAAVPAESLVVGGVAIGRLLGPIAVIAIVARVIAGWTWPAGSRSTLTVVGAYALVAVASLLWTVDPGGTVQALGSLGIALAFMASFAILVDDERDLRRLLWVAAVAAIVLALVYIEGYLSGISRQSNPVGDANFFAAFEVLALPLVVVLASSSRSPGARVGLFVGVAIMAASVIATLSRGGFANLIAIVFLIVVLPSRTLFRSREQKVLFLTAAALGMTVLLSTAWVSLQSRFQQGFHEATSVAGGRGDLWEAALLQYREHPITGIGYGSFRPNSFEFLTETPGVSLDSHLRTSVLSGEPVHNSYIESLAELGPAGLVLFLGLLIAPAASLRRTSRRAAAAGLPFVRSVANALLLGLLAFAVAATLLSAETSRILSLVVGLSVVLPRMARASSDGASSG